MVKRRARRSEVERYFEIFFPFVIHTRALFGITYFVGR